MLYKDGIMSDIIDFFTNILKSEAWPARWQCGKWTEFHGWLYIISDITIWGAYFMIPVLLGFLLYKRKDVPFLPVFWLFIGFIFACGTTHLIDAIIFWFPVYRISAIVRFVTALISWVTVYYLWKYLPKVFNLKSDRQLGELVELKTNELNIANKTLYKKIDELELVSKELSLHNRRLEDFANIISHNLRSPITNLNGMLRFYHDQQDAEGKNLAILKFSEVTNSLTNIVEDLNHVLHINNDINKIREKLDFEESLKHVKDSLAAEIIETKAEITYDFIQHPYIYYPKIYLESILINLLSNALKYRSPERAPKIHFDTTFNKKEIILTCQDNGLGIDLEKNKHKLFGLYKTFHRNEEARGLGLFITKSQIESLGGTIIAESKVNQGTKFIINFGLINI